MKKIIALFVITLGLGFTANAQQKATAVKTAATRTAGVSEDAIQKAAAKDLEALNRFIPLSAADKVSLKGLFEYKQRNLLDSKLSAESKANVSKTIEAKLKATLSPEQVTKLEGNQALLKQLIN